MAFNIDDYVDVAERIRVFREIYPTGSLQQVALEFLEFAGKSWVVYTAAAYRTPDDERPGIGTAWEQVPGKTPYTRDSELQNAETAAWGRALVASLSVDTQRIASKQEVLARRDDTPAAAPVADPKVAQRFTARIGDATDKDTLRKIYEDVSLAEKAGKVTAADRAALHQQCVAASDALAG